MNQQLKITQIGSKYAVETPNGKLHILGLDALKWNLKHVFGMDGGDVLTIVTLLDNTDSGETLVLEVA